MCLFLSPAVTLRRDAIVSALSAGGQGCSLALSLPRPRCPAEGGELGESRRPGSKQSWSHLNESEMQSDDRLLSWSGAACRHTLAYKQGSLAHAHVHLLLFGRGIPGFLKLCRYTDSLSGTLRLEACDFTLLFSAEHDVLYFIH